MDQHGGENPRRRADAFRARLGGRSLSHLRSASDQRAVQRLRASHRDCSGLFDLPGAQGRNGKAAVVRHRRRRHRTDRGALRRLRLSPAIRCHRLPPAARRDYRQHPAGARVRGPAACERQRARRHPDHLHRLWISRLAVARRPAGPLCQPERAADLSRARRQRRVRLGVRRSVHRRGLVPVFWRAARPLRRRRVFHRSCDRRLRTIPRRRGENRDHRLVIVRYHFRQRRLQRGVDRHRDHPDDEELGLQGARRRRHRGGGLDRRTAHAADHGRGRLHHG